MMDLSEPARQSEDGRTTGMLLWAFVGGMTVGAVAALLLAPQPGRASRDQLRHYARRAEDHIRDVAERAAAVVQAGQRFVEEHGPHATEPTETAQQVP